MKRRHWRRLLSLAVTVALLLQIAPVTTLAEGFSKAEQPESVMADLIPQLELNSEASKEAVVVGEEISKREANVKSFRMSDGTHMAVVYNSPVHYLENEQWKDIDNTLVSAAYSGNLLNYAAQEVEVEQENVNTKDISESEQTLTTKNQTAVHIKNYWKNKSNSFQVKLPEILTNESPVIVSNQNYNLRFVMVDSVTTDADLLQPMTAEERESLFLSELESLTDSKQIAKATNQHKIQATNQSSAITYSEVLPHIDLNYEIQATRLKESLILQTPPVQPTVSFDFYCDNLTATLQEDNNVVFSSADATPQFIIAAPYMFDAADVYSEDISVTLVATTYGYRYTLTMDMAWLADENRQYPVTVDPTIAVNYTYNTTYDTTAFYGAVPSSYTSEYESCFLKIGYDSTVQMAGLIKTALPSSVSSNTRVIDAKLTMYYRASGSTATSLTMTAYPLTSGSWTTHTNYFSTNSVPYNATPLDFAVLGTNRFSTDSAIELNITRAVEMWRAGTLTNNGILLRGSATSGTNYIRLYSSDYGGEGYDPYLIITYRDTTGLEDYWTYTSFGAGRDGVASVNNYNGNLIVVEQIAGMSGTRMPLAINLIYNESQHAQSDETDMLTQCGYGWRTNLHMRLSSVTDASLSSNYPYVMIDGDGTQHYFCYQNGVLKDEDGLGLTLTTSSSGNTVKTKDDTIYAFATTGRLKSITDANGNAITITYSSNRISKVTDGAGREYVFNYTSGTNRLSSVKDPAGRITNLIYTNDYLTSIRDVDGGTTTFAYAATTQAGYAMTKITAPDSSYVKFDQTEIDTGYVTTSSTYTSSAHSVKKMRVTKVLLYGTSGTLKNNYTFTYSDYHTTRIVGNTGDDLTYQFNEYGQTVGVVNNTAKIGQYYEYGKPGGSSSETGANKLKTVSKTQSSITNYVRNHNLDLAYSSYYSTQFSQTSPKATITQNTSVGRTANGSIQVTQLDSTSGTASTALAYQEITDLPAGTYVFSAYIKTSGDITASGTAGATISIEVWNDTSVVSTRVSRPITTEATSDWVRLTVTATVSSGQKLRAIVGFRDATVRGTAYFDDLQLEAGEAENTHNLVENNGFYNGTAHWTYPTNCGVTTVTTTPPTSKALRITGSALASRVASQNIAITGNAGDSICFGGWVKLTNVAPSNTNGNFSFQKSTNGKTNSYISLTFYNGTTKTEEKVLSCNSLVNDWQFLNGYFVTTKAYNKVTIRLGHDNNIGSAYFAAPFVFKESFGESYTYDKNGNVVSAADLANTQSTFAYNNDQMSRLLNPTGTQFFYSYDEKNRLTTAVSTDGQRYEFEYDTYGNVISSEVGIESFVTANANALNGTVCYLINAYSGNAADNANCVNNSVVHNCRYKPEVTFQKWKLERYSGNIYYIRAVANNTYVMDVAGGSTANNAKVQMLSHSDSEKQRFQFVKNSDGTYTIKTGASQYTKCLDGQPGAYATDASTDVPIQQCTADSTKASQRWYLVVCKDDVTSDLHLSSSMQYSANGNQVESVIDNNGGLTEYTYNNYGQMTAVTPPNLQQVDEKHYYTTNYTYDLLDRVTNIEQDVIGYNSDDHTPRGLVDINYTYNSDRLSKIDTNTADYFFTYDPYGRQTQIHVGQAGSFGSADVKRLLVTNSYDSRDNLIQQLYGTNSSSYRTFTYDSLDRLISTGYNTSTWARYAYNALGLLGLKTDLRRSNTTRYTYDLSGRLIQSRQTAGSGSENGKVQLQLNYTYEDKTNRLQSMNAIVPTNNSYSQHAHITTAYVYGSGMQADRVTGVKFSATEGGTPIQRLTYAYDALGRRTQSTLNLTTALPTTYTYWDSGNRASTRIETMTTGGNTWGYQYDDEGNIISITLNGAYQHMYNYDSLGQLIEDWDFATQSVICYTYDTGGNITKKQTYANWDLNSTPTTVNYTYGDSTWKNLLTNFNGTAITYDSIGNPANWRDGMTFTWSGGREMSSVTANGTRLVTYTYDSDGIRRNKATGGVTTYYHVQDGVCYGESRSDGVSLQYLRDEMGKVIGYRYQNTSTGSSQLCYFVFNAQGDVVQVVDQLGYIIANYTYDTWGKLLSATNASGNAISTGNAAYYNPFLYRGYYYDYETGFYYLQSRYYDPVVGRFLNADVYVTTGQGLNSFNMFAYCGNNPVMRTDEIGEAYHIIAGAVVGAFVGFVSDVFWQSITTREVDWGQSLRSSLEGAASGALLMTGVGLFGQIAGNTAISMTGNALEQTIRNPRGPFDVRSMLIDGAFGAFGGAIGGPGRGGHYQLNQATKLLNKNMWNSVKNFPKHGMRGAFNGVVSAFQQYGARKQVNLIYSKLLDDLGESFLFSVGQEHMSYLAFDLYNGN